MSAEVHLHLANVHPGELTGVLMQPFTFIPLTYYPCHFYSLFPPPASLNANVQLFTNVANLITPLSFLLASHTPEWPNKGISFSEPVALQKPFRKTAQ